MKEVVWYKYKYYWRRGDNDGDNSPQDRDDGTGDLIFNTMSKVEYDRDTSEWAIKSFKACADLLQAKLRWPDEFNKGNEASSRWLWYPYKWSVKLLKKIGFNVNYKWRRPQNDMTRDPHIAFGACYSHLMKNADEKYHEELRAVYEATKIPWYVYRPNTFGWRKRMIKDDRKHYVKRLSYLRSIAVVDWYIKHDENEFYEDTLL